MPEEYHAVVDGRINAADCIGDIVLDDSANLYKGELNDWFYTPDELTVTFTVVTGEGENAVSDDYEVTFSNATAIPWCPGELNDGQYGHYDLDCTIYLTGYDRYTDPETQAPNGADGGTGNLEALAESCDAGTLTRTIIKQDQYGNEYAGNAVSARYTKTITLPNGARGFQGWYKDGEDAYGNVEWASLLYRMDWEELYGIVDGIKCRATGSGMTEEELRQLFASLNIDATTARGQVVAFALSCQGKFVYAQPSCCAAGRAIQAWASIWIVRALSNMLLGAEPAFFRRQHSRLSERSRPSKYFPRLKSSREICAWYMPLAANRGTFRWHLAAVCGSSAAMAMALQ